MRKIFFAAVLVLTPCLVFAGTKRIAPKESPETVDFEIGSKKVPAFVTSLQDIMLETAGVKIVLSDGSQWLLSSQDPAVLYSEINQNWKVGDDIRIDEPAKEDFFVLKSVGSPAFYPAELLQKSESALYHIEKMDKNGYVVNSSDGSMWVIGWIDSFSSCHWQPGEAITINKSSFVRKEDYLLINHKTGSSCWVSQVSWK